MKLLRRTIKDGRKVNKGFAMLFAVLVSSVLLAIGLSIFNLTVKELALSSSGRESQFAFFAADTGAECALYWDIKGSQIFATSSADSTPTPSNPDCVDSFGASGPQYISINNYVTRTLDSATTQFELTIPQSSGDYCAIVTVEKSSSDGFLSTTIDSRGYNLPCDSTDSNRVERALKITY